MQTKLFILAGEGLAKLETFMTSAVQTVDNIGGKQNRKCLETETSVDS